MSEVLEKLMGRYYTARSGVAGVAQKLLATAADETVFVTKTVAALATGKAVEPPSVASVATVNVTGQQTRVDGERQFPATDATAEPSPNPDRHCWPHTPAMNTAEIEQFKRRLAHFSRMGVSDAEAERLADAWVTEDREGTGRGCCVACSHHSSFGRLRCQRAAAAGVHPELAADFAVLLQRCNAFECHGALGNPKVSQMISEAPEDQEGWP
jgi:hypothetical protein